MRFQEVIAGKGTEDLINVQCSIPNSQPRRPANPEECVSSAENWELRIEH
jgi:hypothetical protein